MGKSYKGIYSININNKIYIGKDHSVLTCKRLKEHMALLESNNHYNKEMQKEFNEYGKESLIYSVLCFSKEYTDQELIDLEIFYIKKFNSYENGFNETIGGIGMKGYITKEETLKKRSDLTCGEKNPQSKLKNKEFFEIIDFFKKGYTNKEIAELYNIHDRYVSLIRHKKRFKKLWEEVNYTPIASQEFIENRSISYDKYCQIRKDKELKLSNSKIEQKYNLSSGQASRIVNGKLYKDYYEKYKK